MATASVPALILGCQRSGTTLLGMMLDSHPAVAVVDEDDQRFHRFGGLTYLLDFDRAVRSAATESALLVFKAPRDTHRVDEFMSRAPGTGLVWITRPVEQVVASMCALHLEADSWAMTHAHREVRKYLRSTPGDRAMTSAFAAALALKDARQKELTLATLCWCAKERSRRRTSARHTSSLHEVDYADLVSDGEQTTRRLCGFLGIEWDPSLLTHHQTHFGRRIGGTIADRSIDSASLRKWQRSLSDGDLKCVEATAEALSQ